MGDCGACVLLEGGVLYCGSCFGGMGMWLEWLNSGLPVGIVYKFGTRIFHGLALASNEICMSNSAKWN